MDNEYLSEVLQATAAEGIDFRSNNLKFDNLELLLCISKSLYLQQENKTSNVRKGNIEIF